MASSGTTNGSISSEPGLGRYVGFRTEQLGVVFPAATVLESVTGSGLVCGYNKEEDGANLSDDQVGCTLSEEAREI